MRVTALGHAGLRIEVDGAVLLCDPWFNPEGAFQASWFQYPENRSLLTRELLQTTAVLISHEHMDHVDPWFLARLPPEVPVIIPRYPSPQLVRKVQSGGPRTVIELPAWEELEVIDDVRVFFVPEESPINHDSAMVIRAGGRSVLNMNDARLSPRQLRRIRAAVTKPVDVFALQAAGASWYPICYEYPTEKAREISLQKRITKLSYVARAIRLVEPVIAMPFAGPPCFLDEDLFLHNVHLGEEGIFPDQDQAIRWLADRGIGETVRLLPGDVWDADTRTKEPTLEWENFSFDGGSYLTDYAARRVSQVAAVRARYPAPTESLWPLFREYFGHVLSMSPYFNEKIGIRVGFDIPDLGGWAVDFRPGREGVFRDMGECQYVYRFESRWLWPILEGKVPWEDFLLSLRFRAWRHPDLYNDHLLGLLKFAWPEALEAVEVYETSPATEETIVVESDGKLYRIQRYCPHAGQDLLETGEVLPGGVIRCLGHHYEFDLATGLCLTGRGGQLRSESIDDRCTDVSICVMPTLVGPINPSDRD
ncbi:MAG TPA: MBL fold metallo-hydrolase [Acidimicrobiia bacterium]|nr:MBL fold metallo-hydrolase [Acidimicrobiia bacterium]